MSAQILVVSIHLRVLHQGVSQDLLQLIVGQTAQSVIRTVVGDQVLQQDLFNQFSRRSFYHGELGTDVPPQIAHGDLNGGAVRQQGTEQAQVHSGQIDGQRHHTGSRSLVPDGGLCACQLSRRELGIHSGHDHLHLVGVGHTGVIVHFGLGRNDDTAGNDGYVYGDGDSLCLAQIIHALNGGDYHIDGVGLTLSQSSGNILCPCHGVADAGRNSDVCLDSVQQGLVQNRSSVAIAVVGSFSRVTAIQHIDKDSLADSGLIAVCLQRHAESIAEVAVADVVCQCSQQLAVIQDVLAGGDLHIDKAAADILLYDVISGIVLGLAQHSSQNHSLDSSAVAHFRQLGAVQVQVDSGVCQQNQCVLSDDSAHLVGVAAADSQAVHARLTGSGQIVADTLDVADLAIRAVRVSHGDGDGQFVSLGRIVNIAVSGAHSAGNGDGAFADHVGSDLHGLVSIENIVVIAVVDPVSVQHDIVGQGAAEGKGSAIQIPCIEDLVCFVSQCVGSSDFAVGDIDVVSKGHNIAVLEGHSVNNVVSEYCSVGHRTGNSSQFLVPAVPGSIRLDGGCVGINRGSAVIDCVSTQHSAIEVLPGHSVGIDSLVVLGGVGHGSGNGNDFLIPAGESICILSIGCLHRSSRCSGNSAVSDLLGNRCGTVGSIPGNGVLVEGHVHIEDGSFGALDPGSAVVGDGDACLACAGEAFHGNLQSSPVNGCGILLDFLDQLIQGVHVVLCLIQSDSGSLTGFLNICLRSVGGQRRILGAIGRGPEDPQISVSHIQIGEVPSRQLANSLPAGSSVHLHAVCAVSHSSIGNIQEVFGCQVGFITSQTAIIVGQIALPAVDINGVSLGSHIHSAKSNFHNCTVCQCRIAGQHEVSISANSCAACGQAGNVICTAVSTVDVGGSSHDGVGSCSAVEHEAAGSDSYAIDSQAAALAHHNSDSLVGILYIIIIGISMPLSHQLHISGGNLADHVSIGPTSKDSKVLVGVSNCIDLLTLGHIYVLSSVNLTVHGVGHGVNSVHGVGSRVSHGGTVYSHQCGSPASEGPAVLLRCSGRCGDGAVGHLSGGVHVAVAVNIPLDFVCIGLGHHSKLCGSCQIACAVSSNRHGHGVSAGELIVGSKSHLERHSLALIVSNDYVVLHSSLELLEGIGGVAQLIQDNLRSLALIHQLDLSLDVQSGIAGQSHTNLLRIALRESEIIAGSCTIGVISLGLIQSKCLIDVLRGGGKTSNLHFHPGEVDILQVIPLHIGRNGSAAVNQSRKDVLLDLVQLHQGVVFHFADGLLLPQHLSGVGNSNGHIAVAHSDNAVSVGCTVTGNADLCLIEGIGAVCRHSGIHIDSCTGQQVFSSTGDGVAAAVDLALFHHGDGVGGQRCAGQFHCDVTVSNILDSNGGSAVGRQSHDLRAVNGSRPSVVSIAGSRQLEGQISAVSNLSRHLGSLHVVVAGDGDVHVQHIPSQSPGVAVAVGLGVGVLIELPATKISLENITISPASGRAAFAQLGAHRIAAIHVGMGADQRAGTVVLLAQAAAFRVVERMGAAKTSGIAARIVSIAVLHVGMVAGKHLIVACIHVAMLDLAADGICRLDRVFPMCACN